MEVIWKAMHTFTDFIFGPIKQLIIQFIPIPKYHRFKNTMMSDMPDVDLHRLRVHAYGQS